MTAIPASRPADLRAAATRLEQHAADQDAQAALAEAAGDERARRNYRADAYQLRSLAACKRGHADAIERRQVTA